MEGRIQRKMILWTLLLVLGLAVISFLFMIRPPDDMIAISLSSRSKNLTKTSRQPASHSQPSQIGFMPMAAAEILNAREMKITCEQSVRDTMAAGIRQVRLRGQPCSSNAKKYKLARVEIKNLTNKMEASVFLLPSQEFTTDYVALLEGENRFEIAEHYADGTTSRHEVILVRPAEEE